MKFPKAINNDIDLEKMRALLRLGRMAGRECYYVHPGDLNWWVYYPPVGHDHRPYIYFWEDPATGALDGWALLSVLDGFFDVYVRPELHGTQAANEMRQWAEGQLILQMRDYFAAHPQGKMPGQISMMWVSEKDRVLIDYLEWRGFTQQEGSGATFVRRLSDPIPAPRLPDGFAVRGCANPENQVETQKRAWAQYGAFESTLPFERYVQRFDHFRRSPVYDPELDVVAFAPGGQIGAFVIAWPDAETGVGLFEPVGTHPQFQRMGLGRAALLEALLRLKQRGMHTAIVSTGGSNTPAIRLYESVGFIRGPNLLTYSKKLLK